jgi:hypothetical protein
MAAMGNPRDIGEAAAEMVLGCTDRAEAVARLVDRLVAEKLIPKPLAESVCETARKAKKPVRSWLDPPS